MTAGISTREISAIFGEEVAGLGGTVCESLDDGARLLARAVLPDVREVQRGDGLKGGVALMAAESEVRVHPYVFRLVCSNGAIRAHAVQTRRIELPEWQDEPVTVEAEIRLAVRACAAPAAFAAGAGEMRSALEQEADLGLSLLPALWRLPEGLRAEMLSMVLRQFAREGGRSRFHLMQAVTAVARDQKDPGVRWKLEECGGAVPVQRPKPRRAPGRALDAPRATQLACV
jgi:hypothetical protein